MHDTDNRFTKGLRNGLVASLLAWAAILLLTTAPRAQTACSYTAGSQTISAAFGVCGTAKQNADADLTSLAAAASTNALYYRSAANTWGPVTVGANLTFSGGTLAGGGDSIRVEDGTDAGTFTASTDADFEDSGNIDFVRTAGPPDQVKANLRTTTVGAATWGSGSSIAWGFDAGATDPQLTFGGNGSVSVGTTGAAAGWLVLADQGALSFSEEVANGSNILSFVPPAAITSNVNCNLVDGAAMIPDSCVGDGSDDDIPEAGDYTNLAATSPITQSGGVISTSIATNRLVGRTTAAAGVMEQITPDATLNLAAGALGVVDVTCTGCLGATEIAALDAGDVTTGALAVARGGTGAAPAGDDQVNISTGVAGATWLTLPDSDAVGTILGYDVTTNTWSTKADDDVPEVGDFGALAATAPITQSGGTISTSMATASIIGRNTAGTGVMEVLAPATVKGILTYLQNAEIDTSAELRTIMTDDVGTGALMFGLISTMNDDLACTGSQVVRRNSFDTAFECATAAGTGDVVGPASATDNAIARFDTTTGKLIQNSAASVDDAGAIRSATNSGANVVSVPLTNWLMLTADYALNNVGTEQKAFNTTTNGRLTLPTGVYRFDVSMSVTGMSATTGNMKFDIIGAGTAVGDRFGWTSYGGDTGTASTAAAISGALQATQESAGNLVGAATATAHWVSLTGMFRVSTGGTVIPSITLTTASAATMKAGSWISIEKIGETGETTVGAWD